MKNTCIAEVYCRVIITVQFGLSADLRYMKDDKKSGKGPEGFILGLRADAYFSGGSVLQQELESSRQSMHRALASVKPKD